MDFFIVKTILYLNMLYKTQIRLQRCEWCQLNKLSQCPLHLTASLIQKCNHDCSLIVMLRTTTDEFKVVINKQSSLYCNGHLSKMKKQRKQNCLINIVSLKKSKCSIWFVLLIQNKMGNYKLIFALFISYIIMNTNLFKASTPNCQQCFLQYPRFSPEVKCPPRSTTRAIERPAPSSYTDNRTWRICGSRWGWSVIQ